MTVRAQIPGHMVPNLPAGTRKRSYKPVVLEDPPGPVGEKKCRLSVGGWIADTCLGLGADPGLLGASQSVPKSYGSTTAYVQLIQDGMTIYAKPQWVWPVAPCAPHLFFLSLASQRPLYVGGLGIGVFCSEGPNILHLGSPETPAQPAFCSPGH